MAVAWSVAVFAHNEARGIAATLRSIIIASEGAPLNVFVLANGCRDGTAAIARECVFAPHRIHVIEIPLGDKANAWNFYVHTISASPTMRTTTMHVFVDGDVQIEPGSLRALAAAFDHAPTINAVGGLPNTGRDRAAWCHRMVANGTLAGGLYALRGDFVGRIRQRGIHIPRGFIGDDWLVSLLAKSDLHPLATGAATANGVMFAPSAGFSFRSLNPWRPRDYKIYLRRLWRYALRGVQFEMLIGWLLHRPADALPVDAEQLYLLASLPSRLKGVGFTSILRALAVQKVRNVRAQASRKTRIPENVK